MRECLKRVVIGGLMVELVKSVEKRVGVQTPAVRMRCVQGRVEEVPAEVRMVRPLRVLSGEVTRPVGVAG